MFSKFRMFRKTSSSSAGQSTVELASHVPVADSPSTSHPVSKKPPSEETRDRIRDEVRQAQAFFADRAQFGIGMACNAMKDPVPLRGFVDFNQYDVDSDNPSFWKLQTQSGLMFGQVNDKGAFVYPADVNKNAPFEDSKLGRGLASFGSQFQPEIASSKPLLKPVGSVSLAKLDQALTFCKTHHAAVAIALLARQLPEPAQCDFVSVRRLRDMEDGSRRISLGVRLRAKSGITKPYRLLLDAQKAVLVEREDIVVSSLKSDVILAAVKDCQID